MIESVKKRLHFPERGKFAKVVDNDWKCPKGEYTSLKEKKVAKAEESCT